MSKENKASNVFKILQDHEKRIAILEGKKIAKTSTKAKVWYKSGSTIEKLLSLMEEGFFNKPHSINEIISELKTKDYHLKASDLTLPLRKIVRRGLFKKIKINADGSPSNRWLYVKDET